jgi:beta-lactam-binding protein with PASTA domain
MGHSVYRKSADHAYSLNARSVALSPTQMASRSFVQESARWLRRLLRNAYFWGGLGGLLLAGVGAYLLLDAFVMPSYTRHGVSVRVPDVERLPYARAERIVAEQGLQVLREAGQYNPNVERGLVVDQNPLPQTGVKPGRRVYLTVNAGTAPVVSVPDFNGISIREAKIRARALGLTVGAVQPDSIPARYPNTITRQVPAPGDSLKQGSFVRLWYSTGLGTDSVRVPNVVGRSVESARRRLLRHQLRSIVVESRSSGTSEMQAAKDSSETRLYVTRQDHAPQTLLRAGEQVRLYATPDSAQVPSPSSPSQDSAGALD